MFDCFGAVQPFCNGLHARTPRTGFYGLGWTGLFKGVPLIWLPACGMYFYTTVFDLVFPLLLAGERVSAAYLAALGHGGLCRFCDPCRYPDCSFGKGAPGAGLPPL